MTRFVLFVLCFGCFCWPRFVLTSVALPQHKDTFALLELPNSTSLLQLAGISAEAGDILPSVITEALARHTQVLKDKRMEAVVRAESEVLKISGELPPGADAAARGAGSVAAGADGAQVQAAVEESISRLEQRLQAFIREEIRRAIITITKLEVPREAPPPPQFTAQQFRSSFARLLPLVVCVFGCRLCISMSPLAPFLRATSPPPHRAPGGSKQKASLDIARQRPRVVVVICSYSHVDINNCVYARSFTFGARLVLPCSRSHV
jgi:hypothetical protein